MRCKTLFLLAVSLSLPFTEVCVVYFFNVFWQYWLLCFINKNVVKTLYMVELYDLMLRIIHWFQYYLVVSCEPLNSIANGKVEYSSTSVSSIATYSCNNGYTMVGPSATVVCNSYGEWEGPVPYCAGNSTMLYTLFI